MAAVSSFSSQSGRTLVYEEVSGPRKEKWKQVADDIFENIIQVAEQFEEGRMNLDPVNNILTSSKAISVKTFQQVIVDQTLQKKFREAYKIHVLAILKTLAGNLATSIDEHKKLDDSYELTKESIYNSSKTNGVLKTTKMENLYLQVLIRL